MIVKYSTLWWKKVFIDLTKQKWNMILHKWALICFNLLFLYCAMYFSLILQFPKTHASNIHSLGVKREYLQFYTFLGIIIDLKLILINCKKLRVKKNKPIFYHLSYLHIDKATLSLLYHAFVGAALPFSSVSYLSIKNRNSLNQMV